MTRLNRHIRNAFLVALLYMQLLQVSAQPKHIYTLPSPNMGWDSVRARIPYPELFRRAGVQAAFDVALRVDSLGKLVTILVAPLNYGQTISWPDSALKDIIEENLRTVEWLPATDNGKRVSCTFHVPFIFYLTYANVGQPVLIHSEKRFPTHVDPSYFFK